jgi:alpha-galactosidase
MQWNYKTQNMMKTQNSKHLFFMAISSLFFIACNKTAVITSGDLQIKFDKNLYTKVNSLTNSTSPFTDVFQLSDYLETKYFVTDKFKLTEVNSFKFNEKMGVGTETILKGNFLNGNQVLTKIISVKTLDSIPNMALYEVRYVNNSQQDIQVKKWVNNHYKILSKSDIPDFWAFQGSSTSERADWIKPLKPGFFQKNFMGMNQSDYGGGVPVTDIWRKGGGIAIGHTEMVPKEVSLPTDFDKYTNYVQIGIEKEYEDGFTWNAGDTLKTLSTFVLVHTGDYFSALRQYSELMQKKGLQFVESEPDAFESMWCGWGYMRKFTTDEILNTLPKVKEFGIKWACIDDGFQIAEGDWRVDTKRFPGGEKDIRKMVDAIHAHGMKAQIWWAPMAADPGSEIIQRDPNVVLFNATGAPQFITWWDSYYLSPAYQGTIDYTKETIRMFLSDWGFDGLKLDGQHMNAVPAEYNWNRPLAYPEQSIEMLPKFFQTIYETARSVKPHALVQHCPCGCCMSFYNMPTTNQFVASDPTSSWQVRLKGKTYKAIAPHTAYFGDHVELSDNHDDFASSFGVGAVLGTKFTWPNDNPFANKGSLLTPEKEAVWKKWFSLYNEKMLSKEEYLGDMYDIGYDIPETHVIKKGEILYYAFYNPKWKGNISLRGLNIKSNYRVSDYYNNRAVGIIEGGKPNINVDIEGFLLLEVTPIK